MLGDISDLKDLHCLRLYRHAEVHDGLCAVIDQRRWDPSSKCSLPVLWKETTGLKPCSGNQTAFILIYKRLSVAAAINAYQEAIDSRNLSWREFDWLMSGIDIDQPSLKQNKKHLIQ